MIQNTGTFTDIIDFIRVQFPGRETIGLHEPLFAGNEKKYLADAVDSTFVSSVGAYVDRFEQMMKEITGAAYAIAAVNGTAALHMALLLAGVQKNEEVITQALTFVATSNAISYTGATPVFVDVDKDTMGMSAHSLKIFLEENTVIKNNACYNKKTGAKIAACVPMHTFGFPADILNITAVCDKYKIPVVEDAAESLGSFVQKKHTGTFGLLGTFSFNGNKIVTSGGGGCIVTNDESLAKLAKHITTTAKLPHKWEYVHDRVGYNYRMPNINAALACAQLEQLPLFLKKKRDLAQRYSVFFAERQIPFVREKEFTTANYWLNTILLNDKTERDRFLEITNADKIMTRPAWQLMNELQMFSGSQRSDLQNSNWLAERIVNIPSSAT
jgi:aminotransferase in exopolysaccharide biosynthesis